MALQGLRSSSLFGAIVLAQRTKERGIATPCQPWDPLCQGLAGCLHSGWGRQALPRVGDERKERDVSGSCAPAGREGLRGGEARRLRVGFGAGQVFIRLF